MPNDKTLTQQTMKTLSFLIAFFAISVTAFSQKKKPPVGFADLLVPARAVKQFHFPMVRNATTGEWELQSSMPSLARTTTFYPNGKISSEEDIDHFSNKKFNKIFFYNAQGQLEKLGSRIIANGVVNDSVFVFTNYQKTEQGRRIYRNEDKNGNLYNQEKTVIEYKSNQILTRTDVAVDSLVLNSYEQPLIHSYRTKDYRVEYQYLYNEKQLYKIRTILNDEILPKITTINYLEYDEYGNWVKCIFSQSESKKLILREIKY